MEDKPKVDIGRFQLKKIKGKYIIKFGLYVIVLVSLWLWYQNRSANRDKVEKKLNLDIQNETEVHLDNFKIEPE